MANFEIPENPEYNKNVRMIQSTDPAHADLFNNIFRILLINEEYLKKSITDLINGAPETLDTLKEVADAIKENETVVEALNAAIGTKAKKSELDTHVENRGTAVEFGHIKLTDDYNFYVGDAAKSIGASQNTVYTLYGKIIRLSKLIEANSNGWQRCANASREWSDLGVTYITYIPGNIIKNGHRYLIKFSDGFICEGTAAVNSNGSSLIINVDWYTKKEKKCTPAEINTANGGAGFTGGGGGYSSSSLPGCPIICMSTVNSNLATYYYELDNIMLNL